MLNFEGGRTYSQNKKTTHIHEHNAVLKNNRRLPIYTVIEPQRFPLLCNSRAYSTMSCAAIPCVSL